MQTVWQETVTRGLAKALMGNFTSVAEALKELVDNAIDYRWGQKLIVRISHDASKDTAVVESDGGRGMGAEDIAVWLNWGEGEQHGPEHIGRWHQGGKAACGFLAGHVKLWAKRKDDNRVWFFEDEDWATRSQPRDFGVPEPITPEQYPDTMRSVPKERGHVKIELTKLNKSKRWNLQVLKRDLASTYATLLKNRQVSLVINGEGVCALEIPLSTATEKVSIQVNLGKGKSVTGWAGRMMRNQLDRPQKAGLRLSYNGRLIKEGEWFGVNHEGKGALNSLIGELEMKGFTPNPNKTDFVERSEDTWEQLGQQVLDQLRPLISELRRSGEESRVTKEEKDRAREVAEELERAFASLDEMPLSAGGTSGDAASAEAGPGGRKPAAPRGPRQPVNPRGPNQNTRQPRTPPPEDAVGVLVRLLENVTGGKRRPPLRIRSWEFTERFAWTSEGSQRWLDINKDYPLYKGLSGSKGYLAETAILALCKPQEGEPMSAGEYMDKVNLMLVKWAEIAGLAVPSEDV
jgi:hypothetical protein